MRPPRNAGESIEEVARLTIASSRFNEAPAKRGGKCQTVDSSDYTLGLLQ